jgi:DNA-binding beta-propeller fold protein YncE
VVADTHEHRIVCYSPSGEILWMLGGYGKGRGEFIYPTDIAFLPDGRMLIAEYGGNDRIQAFGPDRAFMYEFGRCGTGEGEFLRPQAMAYDAERDELYVADAGNHRIEVFTSDGEFRRSVGRPGLGAGEFSYPFGVVLEIGDRAVDSLGVAHPSVIDPQARRTLVVVEHSNHRLQWIDAQSGESLGIAGGLGTENGRLKYPWSIVAAGLSQSGAQRFAVCDNGNSRIVFFALPKSWLGERQRKTDAAD